METDEIRGGLPVVRFETTDAWQDWLDANHATSTGLWIKLAKKESGIPSVTYSEALDVALCYGWIDGQKASLDAQFWLQRFTRRSRRSKWSKINTAKVDALKAQGRMKPAGLREVEAAQADGRWEAAYGSQSTIPVPEDLRARLDENPEARASFERLSSRNRYAILYRIQDAKKPETRARRIEQFIAMLTEGKTIY